MAYLKKSAPAGNGNNKPVEMNIVGKVLGYQDSPNGRAMLVEVMNEGKMQGKQALIALAEGGSAKRPSIEAFEKGKGKIKPVAEGSIVAFDRAVIAGEGKEPYIMTARWANAVRQNPTEVMGFFTGSVKEDGSHNLSMHVVNPDHAVLLSKDEAFPAITKRVLESPKPGSMIVAAVKDNEVIGGVFIGGWASKDANGQWQTPSTPTAVSESVKKALEDGQATEAFKAADRILVIPLEKFPVTHESERGPKNIAYIDKSLSKGGLVAAHMMVSLSDPSGDRETVYVNNAFRMGGKPVDPVPYVGERFGLKVPGVESAANHAEENPEGKPSVVQNVDKSNADEPVRETSSKLDDEDALVNDAFSGPQQTTSPGVGF